MGQTVFKFDFCRCASAGGKQLAPTAVTACKSPNVAVLMFKINTSYIKKISSLTTVLQKKTGVINQPTVRSRNACGPLHISGLILLQ